MIGQTQTQELADEIYETGIGTITIIQNLLLLLFANDVSQTDVRRWFGLLEKNDDGEPKFSIREWFKQHSGGGGP